MSEKNLRINFYSPKGVMMEPLSTLRINTDIYLASSVPYTVHTGTVISNVVVDESSASSMHHPHFLSVDFRNVSDNLLALYMGEPYPLFYLTINEEELYLKNEDASYLYFEEKIKKDCCLKNDEEYKYIFDM